jgi:hypothetical protein
MNTPTIHNVVAALIDGYVDANWHVVKASGLDVTQKQLDLAHEILTGINAQARAWHWSKVEDKLSRAYKVLGGENPATGYDYHCGQHPVQNG